MSAVDTPIEIARHGRDELGAAIAGLRSVYQPIVDLRNGQHVGYEALARGPAGSPLESPGALFAAAARENRVADLDRACRLMAISTAVNAGLRAPAVLFVNAEPEALSHRDAIPGEDSRTSTRQFEVIFEVTERALTLHPADLLRTVERMRAAGFGIALDDVGADCRSLALLPLLRPDVVKLDMSLIHQHPSRSSGEVMGGVCAYAESTGATVVAEGVETERHLLAARSLGATLAQGWYFGRPEPLRPNAAPVGSTVRLGLPPRRVPCSPVELAHARRALSVGRKDVLLSVTRALEAKALEQAEHAVVAACFQHVRHFGDATRERYERLGRRSALVLALGEGMPKSPAPAVRGQSLLADDRLVGEWDLAVLGPHYAGALVARDLGDEVEDRDRRFEFVLTFDRELVVDVAATLIDQIRAPSIDAHG